VASSKRRGRQSQEIGTRKQNDFSDQMLGETAERSARAEGSVCLLGLGALLAL